MAGLSTTVGEFVTVKVLQEHPAKETPLAATLPYGWRADCLQTRVCLLAFANTATVLLRAHSLS